MKLPQYVLLLTVGIICMGLSVATVLLSSTTSRLRASSAVRQAQLNGGILGQQGQQIQSGIMQDLGSAAVRNEKLRKMLERHGYNLPAPAGAAKTNAPAASATAPEQ